MGSWTDTMPSLPEGSTWGTYVETGSCYDQQYKAYAKVWVARGPGDTIYVAYQIFSYLKVLGYTGYYPVTPQIKVGDGAYEQRSQIDCTPGGYGYWDDCGKRYYIGTAAPGTTIRFYLLQSHDSTAAVLSAPALLSYPVTYNGNGSTGGSTAAQTKVHGTTLTLRNNGFTRTGYVFDKWNTKADGSGTSYAAGASYTANAALTLYAIWKPAASTILSVNTTVQTQGTINLTMTRQSSAYYHKATFKLGSTSLQVSNAFATSLSVTVPRTWFNSKPNDTSISVTLSVQTYTDSSCTTAVGSPVTATITVTADSGMKPTVASGWATAAAYNTGAVSGKTGYIKGYSKARVTFNKSKITMANNATIASLTVTCQGATASATVSDSSPKATTGVLASDGSISLSVKVTDSRGRSATETITITVMSYDVPSVSNAQVYRSDSGGTADEDGTYVSVKATSVYSSLNSQNTATLTVAFAASGGSYGSETSLTSGTRSTISGFSPDTSYTARITITDGLGNTGTYSVQVPTRKWTIKFRPTGNGVAFGKASEADKELQMPSDWKVRLGTEQVLPATAANGTVTKTFVGTFTSDSTFLQCDGHLALLNLNVRYSTGFDTSDWTDIYSVSPAPSNAVYFSVDFQGQHATVRIKTDGAVQILAHGSAYTQYARFIIPYFY